MIPCLTRVRQKSIAEKEKKKTWQELKNISQGGPGPHFSASTYFSFPSTCLHLWWWWPRYVRAGYPAFCKQGKKRDKFTWSCTWKLISLALESLEADRFSLLPWCSWTFFYWRPRSKEKERNLFSSEISLQLSWMHTLGGENALSVNIFLSPFINTWPEMKA